MSNLQLNEYNGTAKIRTIVDLIDLLQNVGIKIDSSGGGGGITEPQMKAIFDFFMLDSNLKSVFKNNTGDSVFWDYDSFNNRVLYSLKQELVNLNLVTTTQKNYLRLLSNDSSVFYNIGTGDNDILSEMLKISSIDISNTEIRNILEQSLLQYYETEVINVPANTPIGQVSIVYDSLNFNRLVIVPSTNLAGNLTLRSDSDTNPSKIMTVINQSNNAYGSNMIASASYQTAFLNSRYAFTHNMLNANPYTITVTKFRK